MENKAQDTDLPALEFSAFINYKAAPWEHNKYFPFSSVIGRPASHAGRSGVSHLERVKQSFFSLSL